MTCARLASRLAGAFSGRHDSRRDGVRFIATGTVLVAACGNLALGTLCAIDTRPRTPTPEQFDPCRDVADWLHANPRCRCW